MQGFSLLSEKLADTGTQSLPQQEILPQDRYGKYSLRRKKFCRKRLFCYFFILVRTAPTSEPTRTNGAILINSHSKTWNAVPRTAVSGSPKFQLR